MNNNPSLTVLSALVQNRDNTHGQNSIEAAADKTMGGVSALKEQVQEANKTPRGDTSGGGYFPPLLSLSPPLSSQAVIEMMRNESCNLQCCIWNLLRHLGARAFDREMF